MSYDSDYESSGEPYFTLREEIRRGDLETIRGTLSDRPCLANETSGDDDNYTVLHWAAAMTDEYGLEEANANKYGRKLAIRRKIVCLLLDHEAKAWTIWWQQDFTHISGQRTWDMTEDEETRTILMVACCQQLKESLGKSQEVERDQKQSTLCAAAYLNRVDLLRCAAQYRAEIDNDACDYTALSAAAKNGSLDAIKFLLEECSAKIDHDVNGYGKTALSYAIFAGETKTVKYLIDSGADIFLYHISMGFPLFFCKSRAVIQIVLEAMMEQLPSVLRSSNKRFTNCAFEYFVGFGCIEGLQLLVESGLKFPKNILQKAVVRGQKEMLEYLIAYGALKTHDPKAAKVYAYGAMDETTHPTEGMVSECQKILDDSIQSKAEWEHLAVE